MERIGARRGKVGHQDVGVGKLPMEVANRTFAFVVEGRFTELLAKRGLDDSLDVDPAAPVARHRFIEDDLIQPAASAYRAPAPAPVTALPSRRS